MKNKLIKKFAEKNIKKTKFRNISNELKNYQFDSNRHNCGDGFNRGVFIKTKNIIFCNFCGYEKKRGVFDGK